MLEHNSPSLVIVGEAYGEQEAKYSHPFLGKAGAELWRMLCEAGFPLAPIDYFWPGALKMKLLWQTSGIHTTNVFNERPEDNKLDNFLATKKDGVEIRDDLPALRQGQYLRSEYYHHVERLHTELSGLSPNLILAVGNTACWALVQTTKISALRGTVLNSPFGKVLPTYHPAAVLRNYELRPITITDLIKAKREQQYPEIQRKRREIWVEPEIADLYRWWELFGSKSDLLSVDIETERCKQISEIGIAADSTHALHIPFIVERTKSYWPDEETECEAWKFVKMVMESSVPKVGQNFMYDFQYLWRVAHIPVRNFQQDTMLLHHALFPGMEKSLGFLGSVYTNEPAWKDLRKQGNKDDE